MTVNRYAIVEGDNGDELVKHAQGDWVPYIVYDRLRAEYAAYRADGEPELRAANAEIERLREFIADLAGSDCDNYCKHLSPQPCGQCWSCRARAVITAVPQPAPQTDT